LQVYIVQSYSVLASIYCSKLEEYQRRGGIITEKMDKLNFSYHGAGVPVITEQTSEHW
jgi:hypothetical protein